jgi:hypothetical protein
MHSARRIVVNLLLLASILMIWPALAQENLNAIGYGSVEEALQALRSDPTAKESSQQGWTLFVRSQGMEFWSFTPEHHPAHPSAAKRTAFQDANGAWSVETRLLCQADRASCDALMDDYRVLDVQLRENLRKNRGPGI